MCGPFIEHLFLYIRAMSEYIQKKPGWCPWLPGISVCIDFCIWLRCIGNLFYSTPSPPPLKTNLLCAHGVPFLGHLFLYVWADSYAYMHIFLRTIVVSWPSFSRCVSRSLVIIFYVLTPFIGHAFLCLCRFLWISFSAPLSFFGPVFSVCR